MEPNAFIMHHLVLDGIKVLVRGNRLFMTSIRRDRVFVYNYLLPIAW